MKNGGDFYSIGLRAINHRHQTVIPTSQYFVSHQEVVSDLQPLNFLFFVFLQVCQDIHQHSLNRIYWTKSNQRTKWTEMVSSGMWNEIFFFFKFWNQKIPAESTSEKYNSVADLLKPYAKHNILLDISVSWRSPFNRLPTNRIVSSIFSSIWWPWPYRFCPWHWFASAPINRSWI